MAKKIYVGNMSYDTNESKLRELFAAHGEVVSVSVITDRDTGRPRGFAFIEMGDANEETKAINDLQDVEWMGRMIRVNRAEPRPTASSGGGGNRW